jgi:TPP-dependent indolepyruvate ferredoxin oxidoreductase alpha subunit
MTGGQPVPHLGVAAGGQPTTAIAIEPLVRAAGVMIKRECGFSAAAAKMAAKARPVLERHRARLAAYTDGAALFRILESEG